MLPPVFFFVFCTLRVRAPRSARSNLALLPSYPQDLFYKFGRFRSIDIKGSGRGPAYAFVEFEGAKNQILIQQVYHVHPSYLT